MRASDVGRRRDNPRDPRRNSTDAARARKRRWQKANYNQHKMRARRVLRTALESGLVTRPNNCERCGSSKRRIDGASAIQAHHHAGYDDPLNVQWLCPPCHKLAHADAAMGGNDA